MFVLYAPYPPNGLRMRHGQSTILLTFIARQVGESSSSHITLSMTLLDCPGSGHTATQIQSIGADAQV